MTRDALHDARGAALLPSGEKVPAKRADEGPTGVEPPSSGAARHLLPEGRRAPIPTLAIGLGFRRRCTAETLAGLVGEARARLAADHPALAGSPAVLATIAEKDRPVLHAAAALLGLPVLVLPKAALAGTEDRITVASEAARACLGVPSVAEAAALAAAGPGARLLVARIAAADATCAVAALLPGPGSSAPEAP